MRTRQTFCFSSIKVKLKVNVQNVLYVFKVMRFHFSLSESKSTAFIGFKQFSSAMHLHASVHGRSLDLHEQFLEHSDFL